jgi:hypothetical protein
VFFGCFVLSMLRSGGGVPAAAGAGKPHAS